LGLPPALHRLCELLKHRAFLLLALVFAESTSIKSDLLLPAFAPFNRSALGVVAGPIEKVSNELVEPQTRQERNLFGRKSGRYALPNSGQLRLIRANDYYLLESGFEALRHISYPASNAMARPATRPPTKPSPSAKVFIGQTCHTGVSHGRS
jgi:hypothetical protein